MDAQGLLDAAMAAARDATAVQRAQLGTLRVDRWQSKGWADYVSEVDHAAEAAIVQRIRSAYPGHLIVAEEAATAHGAPASALLPGLEQAEFAWLIDPLDGTTNYLHGYPAYAASIGVLRHGEPVVGVVVSGVTGEAWWATAGGGAFHDGRRITVSPIAALRHALIGTGFPFRTPELLPEYTKQFERVARRTAGIRRAGSAALDLCHVATGYFDGFWELWLAPWDVAAGTIIIREAGGYITRVDGATSVIGAGSILAGNPAIHAALGRELTAAANPDQRDGHGEQ